MVTSQSIRSVEHFRRGASRLRAFAAVILYATYALFGVSQIASSENALVSFLTTGALAYAVTLWAISDGKIRGVRMVPIVQKIFLFTWPIASFVYLFATRRWLGVMLWALNAIALVVVLLVAFYVAYIAIMMIEMLRG